MKRFLLTLLVSAGLGQWSQAQQIHAHNDYQKPEPLTAAIRSQAGSIEADVFLVNGKLLVGHTAEDTLAGRTLESLYIKPIAALFGKHKDRVSADRKYTFQLLIDVKDNGVEAIKNLEELVAPYRTYFDRAMNPTAIQLVISGNRPPVSNWVDYPQYILFDGRPSEMYDDETLRHVGLISDSYQTYSRWNGEGELPDKDRETLKRFIKRAHNQNKPIRFWGSPDTPNAWKQFARLGIDFINTDKVEECAKVVK